jgi:outer membrane protease
VHLEEADRGGQKTTHLIWRVTFGKRVLGNFGTTLRSSPGVGVITRGGPALGLYSAEVKIFQWIHRTDTTCHFLWSRKNSHVLSILGASTPSV